MVFHSSKEKLIFYNIPIILFSLFPLFLITGPFLTDLSISLIGLFFLIYCFKKKNFSYFKNYYFYFFLIFWGYLILNTLINNLNIDRLRISFFYFRYGVFVIAIVALLYFDSKFINYFFFCILTCFIFLICDGFYEYFIEKESTRISSLFGDEKILGSYMSRLWPIFFGLAILILNQKKKFFLFVILIFILSEVLIFMSGERSAFFFINLSAIFVILFSSKLLKLRLFTLLGSIFLIVVISYVNPTAKVRILDKTLVQMNLLNQDKNKGVHIFSIAHTHHYISAYKMFLDNKLLGVGVKNFRNLCKDEKYKISKYSCTSHPHNTYMQILSETGIIGFIFLLTVFIYFCKKLLEHTQLRIKGKYYFNDFEICILSGVAIYLWPIVPTGNVFNNWLTIVMLLNLPFLIWSRKLIKN